MKMDNQDFKEREYCVDNLASFPTKINPVTIHYWNIIIIYVMVVHQTFQSSNKSFV